MICVGLLFFYGSFRTISNQREFAARAKHAQGQVVRMVTRSGSHHYVWVPRFAFHDEAGKQWEVTSGDSNNLAPYHEGDRVEVRYLPEDPAHARLGDLTSSWGISAVLVFCGIFVGGLGGLVYRATPFKISVGGSRG